ncbi:DUF4097 family beta strand repeat-containing protein [Liquorilactobacillus mali]|uniref:DUF4097 domain-containing protein n=1 Tax=Liquorilactobacillus mali TaxID=1618 RepID=A0A0R2FZD0_9LACO|nr:DUF4097 family beta strand repeat-containing protein [Liquorilactobacillus mali]KRN31605.1 hypothetical protein IV36_GL001727 [Liquorilactobacillus mali]
MKKTIIAGFFILMIGILFTGYGYMKKGANPLYIDDWKPKVLTKVASKKVLSKNVSFKKINIKDTTDDIVITRGSHYQVSYQGIKGFQPSVSLSNGSLNIRQKKSLNNLISISNINEGGQKVIITIPKTVTLQDISANVTEGDMDIQNIKTQKIEVKSIDGDISIINMTADSLKIYNENGDIEIGAQSKITEGSFSLVNGDLTAHESSFSNANMTNSYGDIELLNSTVNGGQVKLTEGDFEGKKLGVTGKFSVTNRDGDNTISLSNSSNIGYLMSTSDGDNTLFGKDVGSQVTEKTNLVNQIELTNESGDNEIN